MVEVTVERKKVPSLNTKDPDVHALAAGLVSNTGKSMTEVVREALRRRLEQERARQTDHRRVVARVMEIAARSSLRPILASRTPDEILGYDEHGLPG
jgi:antitoxin VapB